MGPALTPTTIRLMVLLLVIKVAAVSAKSNAATPLKCQNGGFSDGNRCICPGFTTGTVCQNIENIIAIGQTYGAKLGAVLTVNHPYSVELQDNTTTEYLEFKKQYKVLIDKLLQGYNGSCESTLQYGTNGDVRVINNITLILQYNQTVEVKDQYEEMYRTVLAAIASNRCGTQEMCIRSYTTEMFPTPGKYERCSAVISAHYLQFYKANVSSDGLACVTRCAPGTPGYLDCNSGNCQIKGDEGPQCFCPRTDQYLYTYSRCQGAISIVAMYAGVGASIGVLAIVGIILGVFLYRKKYYN